MSDAATLRVALGRGAAAELAHTPDATLSVHLPGLRLAARDPGEIATALGGLYPTPLELLDFRSQEFVAGGQLVGIDARFEFMTEAGVARRMHWLQLEAGLVRQHLVLPEQPRTAAPDAPAPGPQLEALLAGATERRVVPVGYSGARIERLVLRTGEAVYLKYVSATADWHMRVTADPGREGLLYTKGHLGRLPPSCGHAVVLAEPAGSGWAVVTREVPRRRWAMTGASLKRHLSALGDLHATFRGAPPEAAATLRSRLGLWWPQTLASEGDGIDQQPKSAERGWATLDERAGSDTAALVRTVVERADVIVSELEAAGVTLLHGDAHPLNSARLGRRTLLLDWALACAGPPEVEMAWLANFEHLYAFPPDLVVTEALAAGAREPVLRLALAALAAGIIPAACAGLDYPDPAHRAATERKIAWWSHALADSSDLLP